MARGKRLVRRVGARGRVVVAQQDRAERDRRHVETDVVLGRRGDLDAGDGGKAVLADLLGDRRAR